MSINYLEFHSSIPITESSSEMELRNSVSRNHYAILHYLISYAEKKQVPDSVYAAGAHQRVIDAISEHLINNNEERIGKSLKAIFTNTKAKRTTADYFLDEDLLYWEANMVSSALEKVKSLLEPVVPSPPISE